MEDQSNSKGTLTVITIRVLLSFLVLSVLGHTALAHVPIIPRDMAAEQAGDLSAAAGAITLMSLVIFFSIDKTLDALVRQGRFYIGYGAGKLYAGGTTLCLALVFWYVGVSLPCAAASAARAAAIAASEAHVDKPAHGGLVTAVGDNHLEAVLLGDRTLTIYIQGITPTIAFPIKASVLWAKAAQSSADPARVMLHPAPAAGEKGGESSVFTGEVPALFAGKPLDLTVTVPLGGSDHAASFRFAAPGLAIPGPVAPESADSVAPPTHDTSATMIADEPVTPEQHKLFLTPGGAYTAADIAANGGVTPDQKWHGMMANHHLNAKKGTVICPITMTQANPKFPWIVGGKKYLFCCPPCVAEFVKGAKTDPSSLKAPETYVQK